MKRQQKLGSFFRKNEDGNDVGNAKRRRTRAPVDGKAVLSKTADENVDESSEKSSSKKDLVDVGISKLEPGWFSVLENEFSKHYFKALRTFLEKEERQGKKIYPPKQHIFRAFGLCTWEDVKVVIIGQDPYHGPQQANGLAFSVSRGIRIPPSLRNIHKEAISDVKIGKPTTGLLEPWAAQGVLLLNTVLTVRAANANSHKNQGWETFTDSVIKTLNQKKRGLVFLLWGIPAKKKASSVDSKKHYIISSSHPSPLGATKTKFPFIGSNCFSKANAYLVENGKQPIDWSLE